MKFCLVTISLTLFSIASAIPADIKSRANPPNNPIHLANGPSQSKSYKCGKNTYSYSDIFQAAQYAVNLGSIGETRGKAKYPHSFDNDDSKGNKLVFPKDCPADKDRKEYPLKVGGVYDGGKNNNKQGDERVVYYEEPGEIGVDGHPLIYYCGIMTHVGAPTGGFILCK